MSLTTLARHMARRPQRIALLQQIAVQGSITRAAKAAGLSYKSAWDAIDELNNLADSPLVSRSVGGKGGGGARLTPAGERLLTLYGRLEQLQAQLLQAAEDDEDLQLLGRLMLRTSARNQLSGRVDAVQVRGREVRVAIDLAGPERIHAIITLDSLERLELAPGRGVVALIKAGWMKLDAVSTTPDASLNALRGRIERIDLAEDGPAEARLVLPGGQTLCALADPQGLAERGLAVGIEALARFAPDQVLLGVPA